MTEKFNDRSGNTNVLFKTHVGPPVPEKCPECESPLHVAGPMWNGRIHDPQFVGRILEHLEDNGNNYGTSTRMRGMLSVAKEVGTLSPFFLWKGCHRSSRYTGVECTVLLYTFEGGEFLPLHLSLVRRSSVSGQIAPDMALR